MKNTYFKRIGALALCVVLLLACLAGCKKDKKPDNSGANQSGTVTVVNKLGNPVVDAQVYVYEDDSLEELATFGNTDAGGKMKYTATGEKPVAVLKGVAPGYKLEKCYPLKGDVTIELEALAPTEEGNLPEDAKIEKGDPMVDFTFTDMDGNTYTASEVLKEKKALVLNFWFTTCEPCAQEFPYLQKAYDTYKDSVALLAVNPYETDDADKINEFVKKNKLSFPVVDADPAWASLMNITAYPTTLVIDRYGFVAFAHTGTVTEEGLFEKLFAYYGAEEYQSTITDNFDDLFLVDPLDPDAPSSPEGDKDPQGLIYNNKNAPIEFGSVLKFDAQIPAGKTTYYNVYRVSGTYLNLKADDAEITYNGKTYKPTNGVISFPVNTDDVTIPVNLAITNKGKKTATFKVTFGYPAGTFDNPHSLKMGDFTTKIQKGNDKGVVYEYKATKSGIITMYVKSITKGVDYGFSLFNKRNSAMRNSDEDVVTSGSKKTVSIEAKKGDVIQVIVSTLPNKKHEYPAATIKSNISFKSANVSDTPVVKKMTYQARVYCDGAPLAGVKLSFTVDGTTKTTTTSSKGIGNGYLPAGTCTLKLTCPKGYIAEKLVYTLTANSPKVIINLTKEEELSTEVGTTPTDYSVKVVDGTGAPQKGITVSYYLGSTQKATVTTDADGLAPATLLDGTYTVKLSGTSLKYDTQSAVVTVANPSIEVLLAKAMGTQKEKVTCPLTEKSKAAYVVDEGATYVTLKPGERNYFLFTPERNGVFRFSSSNKSAKVGYYGGTIHYISTTDMSADWENNAFTFEVKDVGPTIIIGVDAATNVSATALLITRIGDPGWSVADEPWHVYEGTHTPKQYKLPSGTKLVNMDVTKTYKLVYNTKDGYYHKDTANGPLVYLRFGETTPYISFANILSNFHISAYLYDTVGNFVKKEEYTECMDAYNKCVDATETVYPLTKDLEYIVKQYGIHQGWWDPTSPGFLFEDEDGNPLPDVNLDSAWMFALCYAK